MELRATRLDKLLANRYHIPLQKGKFVVLAGNVVIEICASLKDAHDVINARRSEDAKLSSQRTIY